MRRPAAIALALWLALPPGLPPAVAAESEPVHVVQPGETLWHIAAATLGDPHRWPELYRANRDQIADPAVIFPGQRLRIPPGPSEGRGPGAAGAPPGSPRPR